MNFLQNTLGVTLAEFVSNRLGASPLIIATDSDLETLCESKNVSKKFKKFLKKKGFSYIRDENMFYTERASLIEFLVSNGKPETKYALCHLPFEIAKMAASESEALKARSYVL